MPTPGYVAITPIVTRFVLVVTGLACVALALLVKPLIFLLFGREFASAQWALLILLPGVLAGSLMSAGTRVDALIFRYITSGATLGVKTELHIYSSRGAATDVDHFYNTSVLRGSY